MLPSSVDLIYFSEVCVSLNLSRASEKLGVSQPSLSQAMKRLENTLGTHLFVRHKQGVTLTLAGEALLLQVKQLLGHWDNIKREIQEAHAEVKGRVSIGCRSSTAPYIAKFVSSLLEKHPQLAINFIHQSSQDITEGVINSSIDAGIVINPYKHADLIIHHLLTPALCFWTGPGDRSIQRIDSGEAVIICEPNSAPTQLLLKKLEKENRHVARVLTANSLEVVLNLTLEGCGIGILPACFVQSLSPNTLKRVETMPECVYDICLIYRYESKKVKSIYTVITELKEYIVKQKAMNNQYNREASCVF